MLNIELFNLIAAHVTQNTQGIGTTAGTSYITDVPPYEFLLLRKLVHYHEYKIQNYNSLYINIYPYTGVLDHNNKYKAIIYYINLKSGKLAGNFSYRTLDVSLNPKQIRKILFKTGKTLNIPNFPC